MALKRRILCSASLGALVFVTPVTAQTAPADAAADGAIDSETQDEIVVTGVRASLIEGLQNKREATQIIESVVAEDVGKLPDNNVVEALQRVTGVQVTNRTGGEASAISIRGLPDITTTWNGRNIFTASGRQFALADIPANLVKRIDVYKTRAAEQIETGIAGQVVMIVNVASRCGLTPQYTILDEKGPDHAKCFEVAVEIGSRHPITLMRNRIISIFQRLGFSVADGPEIEDDFHNFTALNLPENHPARDMQDTFYIHQQPDWLLRTHTSNVQIR